MRRSGEKKGRSNTFNSLMTEKAENLKHLTKKKIKNKVMIPKTMPNNNKKNIQNNINGLINLRNKKTYIHEINAKIIIIK